MGIARLFRPHSIVGLIIIGFTLALLPLAVALAITAAYVNRLADHSQIAMVQAAEASQGGRLLMNQIIAMERSVRQYLVLGDEGLLEVYRENQAAWRNTLERLSASELALAQRAILSRLDEREKSLSEVIAIAQADVIRQRLGEFEQLRDLARVFLGQSAEWVDREVDRLEALAQNATSIVSWVLITVVPAALVLAGGFGALIVRPLRDIANAIHRLGSEDFSIPVVIQGPRDLRELGARLDWLRQRLAELEEQKAHFLRHISHEIKTPLTALREGVELMADQVAGKLTADQREIVAILRENTLRLQKMIEDLLTFQQALSRSLALHKHPLDLAELVRSTIEAQQLTWKARKLTLTPHLESVRLEADWEKLRTVVDNLLSNAIKFSPPGGEIRIELRTLNGAAQLEIRDQGPGFHPDDRPRVFEPFYQGRYLTKGHVKGSGLGLAIALEYALMHRGALEIVDAPGACMRLTLPLV